MNTTIKLFEQALQMAKVGMIDLARNAYRTAYDAYRRDDFEGSEKVHKILDELMPLIRTETPKKSKKSYRVKSWMQLYREHDARERKAEAKANEF